jgi:ABC-type transport system involved in multi-copper enzyme maturation permease subunit
MTLLPSIERELLSQARSPAHHTWRVAGAAALLVESGYFGFSQGFLVNQGGELFRVLNGTLLVFLWLVVPLTVADCISRERREGTIGLLFLTPLKARDIVLAKGLAHGLRALTLWLATLPVMALPFLLGGVGWREAVWSAQVNFSSLCGALGAGLLASCLSKQWTRAQVLACFLALAFAMVFFFLLGFAALEVNYHYQTPWARFGLGNGMTSNDLILQAGVQAGTGLDGDWAMMFAEYRRMGLGDTWLFWGAAMMVGSLLALWLAIQIAAVRLRRVWQEQGLSARQQRVWAALSTPVIGASFLRRWVRRKLERNPVGWLETRSWTGRTVMWGWFATAVTIYASGLPGNFGSRPFHRLQHLMVMLLLIGMAVSSAASFQRERESGVMELLLVSPMTERQIISGRVRSLWGQFLPALGLVLAVWVYVNAWLPEAGANDIMVFLCGAYLAMPFTGLYNSLRRRNFMSAFLQTLLTVVVLPYAAWQLLGFAARVMRYSSADPVLVVLVETLATVQAVVVVQLLIAARVSRRLHQDLKQRNFAFSRSLV